jgi:hypothetical protein
VNLPIAKFGLAPLSSFVLVDCDGSAGVSPLCSCVLFDPRFGRGSYLEEEEGNVYWDRYFLGVRDPEVVLS